MIPAYGRERISVSSHVLPNGSTNPSGAHRSAARRCRPAGHILVSVQCLLCWLYAARQPHRRFRPMNVHHGAHHSRQLQPPRTIASSFFAQQRMRRGTRRAMPYVAEGRDSTVGRVRTGMLYIIGVVGGSESLVRGLLTARGARSSSWGRGTAERAWRSCDGYTPARDIELRI